MSGPVRTLRLDTGRMNLLTTPAVRKLRSELRAVCEDPQTRAIALFGRDDAFCAGLDTKVLAAGDAAARELFAEMGGMLVDLYAAPVPIVAGCGGHAMAAGAMMLLTSDVRIGADARYRVGFSEVAVGLPLPELPVLLARDRLDPRRLQEATLFGTRWDPEQAVDVGFLDRLVPAGDLEDEALAQARDLAELPGRAYADSIASVRGATLARMRALLQR